MKTNPHFLKRAGIAVVLGIGFGFLCVRLASQSNPDIRGTTMMWNILFNRFLIALVVTMIGVYSYHPAFGFRVPILLRGFIFGAIVSIDLAIGVFMNASIAVDQQRTIFWMTILAGGFYGAIIDLTASYLGGKGEKLLIK